jgi:hypothetical protein
MTMLDKVKTVTCRDRWLGELGSRSANAVRL